MNKYLSILSILAVFQLNASAQKLVETNVPTAVKTNFATILNNTPATSWELEDGQYEASYVLGGVENSVLFSSDGKLIQYENTITANDVPEAARQYITTHCTGKKMGDMTRIKTVTGSVSYEIEVGNTDYLFDSNGTFIKMEEEEDDDKETK